MPNPSQCFITLEKTILVYTLHSRLHIQIAKIQIMGVSKTSDHIQIKTKMPNPSQEPPASFKAVNEDLKDTKGSCLGFGILILIWIYSLAFDTPMT